MTPTLPEHLFVYGTLLQGAGHPMHEALARDAQRVGVAHISGTLFAVSWYPGLVRPTPQRPAPGLVRGELWRIRDLGLLETLDEYEGASPDDPTPREFERESATVNLAEHLVEAWVYVYRGSTAQLDAIESGDWLDRSSCSVG